MRRPERLTRRLAVLVLALVGFGTALPALALDLDSLAARLAAPAVIRGTFIQEKYLRGLPRPLQSRGQFTLSREYGLLWELHEPLRQDYRIDARGIARRDAGYWQPQEQASTNSRQQRLLLAVLRGDIATLQEDFEIVLDGSDKAWQLTLTPRSALLQQVFTQIRIQGNELAEVVELIETQGDRTLLDLHGSAPFRALNNAERNDFTL